MIESAPCLTGCCWKASSPSPRPAISARRAAGWVCASPRSASTSASSSRQPAAAVCRDTHSVAPTPDGEAMEGFALHPAANDRARRYFAGSQLRGRLRSAPPRISSPRLPEVRRFHPGAPSGSSALTVDLQRHAVPDAGCGDLDLAPCKRRTGDDRGRLVWRDRLAWIGTAATRIDPAQPLPLHTRRASRGRRRWRWSGAGRPWRIVCSSGSPSGLRAAALAGLGVTVMRVPMLRASPRCRRQIGCPSWGTWSLWCWKCAAGAWTGGGRRCHSGEWRTAARTGRAEPVRRAERVPASACRWRLRPSDPPLGSAPSGRPAWLMGGCCLQAEVAYGAASG